MISAELIRRFPFFAGLSYDQIVTLAKTAGELTVEAEHYFFHEGDTLQSFYLVLEGAVAIVIEVPNPEVVHKLSDQLTGKLQMSEIVISAVGPGEVFGWSALVPPHQATTTGKAATRCRVISFDCQELRQIFDDDCKFGYVMMQKTAQIIRDRLRAMRIETLAHLIE